MIEEGRVDLRLGTSTLVATTSHVEECPDLGPQCSSSTPPTAYRHHVKMWMNETALDGSYGLTPWLAVEGRFALRLVDVTPTYFELDGTPKQVPNDIHHHNETIFGPGDPWLLLRTGARSGKLVSSTRVGVTLPLGSTVPDPYELGREGKSHEHIQFGTGTVIPVVGGGIGYGVGNVDLAASVLGLFSLYDNGEGFRAPSRFFASTRATLHFEGNKLAPFVAADFAHESRERWHGASGDESYVRNDILAGGGLGWSFAPTWQAEIGLRLRAANLSTGATLDYPGVLQLSIATHLDTVATVAHAHQH